MWVMIVTILFYGNPSDGRFAPAVTSIQFNNKESCEVARGAYLAAMKPTADMLNAYIKEHERNGTLMPPNGVLVSALCVAQG
jgi:hypothetical protein